MAANDVLVILGCLVLGYVVVSFLIGGKPRPDAKRTPESSGAAAGAPMSDEPPTPPRADSEPPHWSVVLEIARDANVDEIRAAYRRLIGQYHPDKVATLGQALRELADVKSREITHAYQWAIRDRAQAPRQD